MSYSFTNRLKDSSILVRSFAIRIGLVYGIGKTQNCGLLHALFETIMTNSAHILQP